ncbi:MAG TPA: Do family serine endopeptidase [Desulfomonilia bacterium]|nr:Do family serine endopeptidase [Desulfomonilia bacterium]
MSVSSASTGSRDMHVTQAPPTATPMNERDFRNAIINVAKQNIPAVVHIEVTQRQEVINPFSGFDNDPFFRHFFDFPQTPRKFKRELKGIGTGMIINDDGFILTNNHVVTGATRIQVILPNESQYEAKVIGTDPKTDLAVIKVNAKEKLPHVTFGDSDKVQVGEWVVAIGHPRGLDQTVTQGIISAKHRQGITDPNTYQDFLQTDAAINPGNSGGPLLNLDGQVIGVNSIIASQSGGSEGLGFAIPSNMAIHISKSLMGSGKVQRGWLGISLQDIAFDKMKSLKLDSTKGAYVMDVMKDSPAAKAGIKAGDVILTFDGKDITDSGALRNLVASTPIGKEVKLGIIRDGQKLSIAIRVGNLEDASKIMESSIRNKLGVDVRPLKESETSRYGIDQDQGVAISWLDQNGPMAKAGFEINDVIIKIDDQPIDSVEKFTYIVNTMKSHQTVTIYVIDHRTGQTGYIQVQTR